MEYTWTVSPPSSTDARSVPSRLTVAADGGGGPWEEEEEGGGGGGAATVEVCSTEEEEEGIGTRIEERRRGRLWEEL